jgi:SAM-dependent methyltransferase
MNSSVSTNSQPPTSYLTWFREGISWRLPALRQRLESICGIRKEHWARIVMDRTTSQFVQSLNLQTMRALEISGQEWNNYGFKEYVSACYPEYDVCAGPYEKNSFDVILAQQVLEHVLWPYRAVKHVYETLRPGGWFIVTTPFLLRVHDYPVDCSRWTELGLKHLLAEGGFYLNDIQTGSWGNRACVRANFNRWARWIPWLHSLKNERLFPVVVWAFAQKQSPASKGSAATASNAS